MNEPTNDHNVHDIRVERLRALKPRTPQLDWEAIHSARSSDDSNPTQTPPASVVLPIRVRPAVAWWSGLVAGVAITFFAMQWFVLSELRSELYELKQTARGATSESTKIQTAVERSDPPTASLVDINSILDRSDLSVGSYRGYGKRMVHTSASSEESPSIDNRSQASGPLELDRPEPTANRLLLLQELKQVVH